MKIKLEYIWLDGYMPEPNLRSKLKLVDYNDIKNAFIDGKFPEWNFDGSSTKQAQTGSSDCILKPVRYYTTDKLQTVYLLCEVMNPDGTPHVTNTRSKLIGEEEDLWFGFEQEYFIYDRKNKCILGHDENNLEPQGKYYCGVGEYVAGRDFVEEHMAMCLNYGINLTGINAEVALGQWEYQVFSKGKLKAGDDLWMSRYFLHKISEKYNYGIDLHPKPIQKGEWNGSGLHTNFSNGIMRNNGDEDYFMSLFYTLGGRHQEHIKSYGSSNDLRLTGEYETQSIDKFSWGVSDRGASIRVPQDTAKEWKGYVEDRRPGSNADPYKVIYEIVKTFETAEQIYEVKSVMSKNINTDGLNEKYGTMSNEELLSEYRNDEEYEVDSDTMDGSNISTEEMEFDMNHSKSSPLPEALKKAMMNASKVEIK